MYVSLQSAPGMGYASLAWDIPMPPHLRKRSKPRGLGANPSAGQIVAAGGTGVTTGIATKSAVAGAIAGGLATAALYDPEPISKAILAISAAFVGPLTALLNRGCGQTCIIASKQADAAQQAADQIAKQYWGAPVPRPRSLQAAALTAMQNVMDTLRAACSDPALGDAGRRCISERLDPAACHIKDAQGGCHNFFIDYVQPIQNDSNVAPDSPVTQAATALGLPSTVGGFDIGKVLMLGAAALGVWALAE